MRFAADLETCSRLEQARDLALQTPPPSRPDRKYHANLWLFLSNLQPPDAATADEIDAYLRLVERFIHAGELEPEAGELAKRLLLAAAGR
jgi:hypothetical protein